ncbi:MAG: hypothetical protein WB711_01105, partial [Terriglobales bacterium]
VLWKQERFVVLRPLQIEFFRSLLVKRLPNRRRSPEIVWKSFSWSFGERRAKPASALKFVGFLGMLTQFLEMVGIKSPSRTSFNSGIP